MTEATVIYILATDQYVVAVLQIYILTTAGSRSTFRSWYRLHRACRVRHPLPANPDSFRRQSWLRDGLLVYVWVPVVIHIVFTGRYSTSADRPAMSTIRTSFSLPSASVTLLPESEVNRLRYTIVDGDVGGVEVGSVEAVEDRMQPPCHT